MCHAIVDVGRVDLREAVDDLADTGRSDDLERRRTTGDPALRDGLAEVAEVVGMKMSEQHATQRRSRKVGEVDRFPRAGSDVDEPEFTVRDQRRARSRAPRVGQRRAGAAQHDLQVGRLEDRAVDAREVAFDLTLDQAIAGEESGREKQYGEDAEPRDERDAACRATGAKAGSIESE